MVVFYQTYTPQPPLATFVNSFWLYETNTSAHARERRLPDGSMELVIPLHDNGMRVYDREHQERDQCFRSGLISGAQAQYSIIDTASLVAVVGMNFKPGGTLPFLPLPASELHNTAVSLDTLWGAAAVDLHEQLLAAQTPWSKFYILEQFLLAQLACPRTLHPAVTFALSTFQNAPHLGTISAVTEQIGLSPKRFIKVFYETVGLTPKQFCRIRRFQEVLHHLEGDEAVRWVDIALSCGYFDQAHFNHDFRAFSGLNPGAYLAQRGSQRNHVPLLD